MTTSANAPALTETSVRDLSRRLNEPAWLLNRRLAAWRAYEAMAMPNPLDEEWRRTDISGFDLEAALALLSKLRDSSRMVRLPRELTETKDFAGVLMQAAGQPDFEYRAEDLPRGLIFRDLASAARQGRKVVEEHMHSLVRPTDWKLQALEAAMWQHGALVYVPRGAEVALPLRYVLAGNGGPLFPHLLIVAEENSSVTVIQETYSPEANHQALVTGAVEIIAKPDARVRFLEVQRWGSNVFNFSTIRARLDRGAELTAGLVGLGSRLTKTKLEAILEGEGASAELFGLSFGDGSQHFDYGTLQDHVGPRTTSDLLFKAALEDSASQVWSGAVRIRKGASQSAANQTSRNLLLSDKAKAAPIPVLEIEAYDILRCSHGATAGPLDEEQRFYLESRGIPKDEAQRLLVEAFFQPVLDRMPAAAVRGRLEKALAAKIEAGY
jgi:Fe-S cluster assembly protein SufD